MRRIYLLIVLFLCSSILACKKNFLDVVDKSILTRQGYVNDLNTLGEYVNGIYGLYNQYILYMSSGIYPELVADNIKPLSSSPQFLIAQYSWSQQKSSQVSGNIVGFRDLNMNAFWQSSYLIIRSCNFVIETVDKYRSENPQRADQIKGEVLALRSLLHFQLVNFFAQTYSFTSNASHPGVPYIIEADITIPFTRQTVGEVYDNMISDLQQAVELMAPNNLDARRLNKLAAEAILARVYLFKGDFTNAKKIAKQVIERSPLSTIGEGYPDALFAENLNGTTEVLFQGTPGDVINSTFAGRYLRGEYIFFLATSDIAEVLQENQHDIRSKWVSGVSTGWNITKFPEKIAGLSSVPEADYYQPIIRTSEMALTAAEADFKTGDEEGALLLLNQVRRRANPAAPMLSTHGNALLDSIYKERRKELAFEGLRMFDLQRNKLGVYRKDALDGSVSKLPFPHNKAIAPIPMRDVSMAGLSQNVDY